jgi:hypothetical protein
MRLLTSKYSLKLKVNNYTVRFYSRRKGLIAIEYLKGEEYNKNNLKELKKAYQADRILIEKYTTYEEIF